MLQIKLNILLQLHGQAFPYISRFILNHSFIYSLHAQEGSRSQALFDAVVTLLNKTKSSLSSGFFHCCSSPSTVAKMAIFLLLEHISSSVVQISQIYCPLSLEHSSLDLSKADCYFCSHVPYICKTQRGFLDHSKLLLQTLAIRQEYFNFPIVHYFLLFDLLPFAHCSSPQKGPSQDMKARSLNVHNIQSTYSTQNMV